MPIDFKVDFQPETKLDFKLDFQEEDQPKSKRKTTLGEDVKIALANVTKTAGMGFGGLVSSVLPREYGDKLMDKLEQGAQNMQQWANPENAKQNFGGKFAGNVATLPLQLAAMPFTPVTTGQEFIDQGESLPRALAATGIETAGNLVGTAAPMLGATLPMKAATTFGFNAAQDFATKKLKQATAKEEETKKLYEPTFEDAVLAGTTGLPLLALPGGRKTKAPEIKRVDFEEPVAPKPQVPEQLELPLETSAQTIAEQQARQGAQMDLFAPQNQQLMGRVPNVSPEAVNAPIPNEAQGHLPFSTGLDELARTQRAGDPQLDMFANEHPQDVPYNAVEAQKQAQSVEQLRQLNKEGTQQHIVEDFGSNDPMDRMPNMRVDENGMPIRADLSMELQNLENPLQRNLWGDELGPALDQTRSLTEAIDSMPAGKERDTALANMAGQPMPRRIVPRNQRGAIDASIFEDLFGFGKSAIRGSDGKLMPLYHGTESEFKNIKESTQGGALGNGVYLAVRPEYASSYAEGLGGNVHQVYANITNPLVIKGPGDPMVNALVSLGKTREQANRIVEKAYDEKGYITNEVRSLARKAGYDGLVQYRGDKPSEIVAFDRGQVKSAISPEEKRIPAGQRGAVDFSIFDDIVKGIKSLSSKSPEVLQAAKNQETLRKQEIGKAILNRSTSGYVENVRTPEDVVALADKAKDIPTSALIGGKTVTPGVNTLAIKNPNPLVKYMRSLTRDVFVTANQLAEKYVVGKDGIGPVYSRLSKQDRIEVTQALMEGDKRQQRVSEAMMDRAGFNEMQKEFVNKYYEMDSAKLSIWNENLAKVGQPPVEERVGHVPGIFGGDFRQLVLDKNGKPVYFIGTDFKWQLKTAQDAVKKKLGEDIKFLPMQRSKLAGTGRGKDFQAIMDTLNLLAEHDKDFASVKKEVSDLIAKDSNKAYGAAYQAMDKKGIGGSYGRKDWLSPEKNVDEFWKSYFSHWEEQMISHLSLPVEQNMRGLMENPVLTNDKFGNAKEYVNDYMRNMTGRNLSELGQAGNLAVDFATRMLSGGQLGTSAPRALVSNFNAGIGRWTEGFGNLMFSGAQFLQTLQTGVPEVSAFAQQLKLPAADAASSFNRVLLEAVKSRFGKESETFSKDFNEAKNRGLLTFSEFNDIGKITQPKAMRKLASVADYNRVLPEQVSRPWVFMATVDLLRKNGIEGKQAYDTAYNVAQAGMFDYGFHERPMIYASAGLIGQLMGKLTTFKHNTVAQANRMGQNAGRGEFNGAAIGLLTAIAFAGLKGLPGFDDADQLIKLVTNDQTNLREIVTSAAHDSGFWNNEALWSGALSTSTGLNFQSRLSSADLVPNSIPEAISPYTSFATQAAKGFKEATDYNTPLAWGNAAINVLPTSTKGIAREALITDSNGMQRNAKGQLMDIRSDKDRLIEMVTGTKSLNQALTSQNRFNSNQKLKAQDEQRKAIVEKASALYLAGKWNEDIATELSQKYIDNGGDPKDYVRDLVGKIEAGSMDRDTRTKGIPKNNMRSINRYMEHSKDKVTGY